VLVAFDWCERESRRSKEPESLRVRVSSWAAERVGDARDRSLLNSSLMRLMRNAGPSLSLGISYKSGE